jgi:hypothetical protein
MLFVILFIESGVSLRPARTKRQQTTQAKACVQTRATGALLQRRRRL